MTAFAANRTSVPQIWISQKHIGGCDDLKVMVDIYLVVVVVVVLVLVYLLLLLLSLLLPFSLSTTSMYVDPSTEYAVCVTWMWIEVAIIQQPTCVHRSEGYSA